MKKLALLLAALGLVSAVAYTAEEPKLKVTSIGQEFELENTSGGSDIGEDVWATMNVGLSYGKWTFGVLGGKIANVDSDEYTDKGGRFQFDAMRNFGNYQLGFRYRIHNENQDRWYLRGAWQQGMFWGSADLWYQVNQGTGKNENDVFRGEIFPLGIQYKDYKVGWFVDWTKATGNLSDTALEESFEHQLRFYAPIYKGEKLTLSTEYRLTLTADNDYQTKDDHAGVYEDFGRHRLYIKANYKVTESLDVYGHYAYELRDREFADDGKSCDSDNYFNTLLLGWKYKF